MSIQTYEAAYRYFDQMFNGYYNDFHHTLAEDAEVVHCRMNGDIPSDQTTTKGADAIFKIYKEKFFDVTFNFDVKQVSIKCDGLTATCKYIVDETKHDLNGLQGRYRMKGKIKLDFVQKGNELKIQNIWDATSAIKLGDLMLA